MNSEVNKGRAYLSGAGVLVTRPLGQAEGIESYLKAGGAEPYVFPCLEISLNSAQEIRAQLEQVQSGDILIFVSSNAVLGLFQSVSPEQRAHLSSVQIAAVGKRTQAALEDENVFVAIAPDNRHQNSEGLLHNPLLQELSARHVYIVRGQSGRELLHRELTNRGAQLAYIQTYTRQVPDQYDAAPIAKALDSGQIQYVMLTSFEAFENLLQMLGEGALDLLSKPRLIVAGGRIAWKINEQYSLEPVIAEGASDQEMLTALELLLDD